MAAPVVTTSFTADVQGGVPPFTVQFTDTTEITDGFARYWLWEFGDGSISTEQNPSHLYDGDPGEGFTVKLTVLATTGEFDALTFQDLNATSKPGGTVQAGSGNTESDAWDAFLAFTPISFANFNTIFWLTRTGGTLRQYTDQRSTIEISTNFNDSFYVLTVNPTDLEIFQGFVNVSSGGSVAYSDNTPRQEHSRILGLSTTNPLTISCNITPIENLPDTTGTNQQHGMNVSFTLRTYLPNGNQRFSDHEEVDFIVMGVPPIADFEASPVRGPALLGVQFDNTSIEAIGLPTTYSWKKRKSGIGAEFVEFSTEKNPSHIFSK